ncbi:nuclear transport factor 2 family protein [Luteimonas aquatica]|uniref:nuclear transport factor 2 family protein n=1 Tax=Luteimonas aquatica TaxID=450364 RepID=UPI001F57B924|nr:nuclear transport factor 2 family protein [Luteimonas aquatica]
MYQLARTIAALCAIGSIPWPASAACPKDAAAIVALDREYQAAVERRDAGAIERLLPEDFILVTGKGRVYGKADLLAEARGDEVVYQRQDDASHVVRFIGETAVVTALLHAKGTEAGKPFDDRLWFSDLYLCTAGGWRYSFAQASIPLPD